MFISPPEKTFGQSWAERLILVVPVVIVLLITLGVSDFQLRSMSSVAWGFIAGTLALYAFACFAIAQRKLQVFSDGIQQTSLFGAKEMRWDEVSHTYYYRVANTGYYHFGLIGLLLAAAARGENQGGASSSSTLIVVSREPQRKIKIGSNVKNFEQAARMVLAKLNPKFKKDVEREIGSGATVSFGPVSLSQLGIAKKAKEPIQLARAKISFNGIKLRVKEEGKWLDAISVSAKKVPNVSVLLELADEMQRGGKPAEPDPLAYLNK